MTLRRAGKTLGIYAVILLVMLTVGLLLLEGAAFLPQDRIVANYAEGFLQFETESYSPKILNVWRSDARLNNRSELQILQYSLYMDARQYPDAVLSNPGYVTDVSATGLAEMRDAALAGTAPNNHYVRYWQGFRAVVRALLTVCHYGDMRRLLMWLYCGLAALCAIELTRRTRGREAPVAFALSLMLFNPVVVSTSFQFGCCYLIAMAGMLAVSLLHGRVRPARVLFGVAIATQFFDYYTAPSLTLVYPLLMALVCAVFSPEAEQEPLWRIAVRCIVAWMAGYVLMWGCKLLLVTLFTEHNGLKNGLGSLAGWLTGSAVKEKATVGQALEAAFSVLGMLSMAVSIAYSVLTGLWNLRKGPDRTALGRAALCAAMGLISLVWIAVAAQPTAAHAYFQYRTLGGLIFALMLAPVFLAVSPRAQG